MLGGVASTLVQSPCYLHLGGPPGPTHKMDNYLYCNKPGSINYALRYLQNSPYLILDCEGKDIGRTDGVLSLMCIGTANAEHIFVFDVIALRPFYALMVPLLDMLRNPLVHKIMWDCRNDFLEISGVYGIQIEGIIDLQLAEVESRRIFRGEKEWRREGRISAGGRRLPVRVVKDDKDLFKDVHVVQGMDACLRECHLATGAKDPEIVAMHRANGSVFWLERPLRRKLLVYASHDIQMLADLYSHFLEVDWITTRSIPLLLDQGARYAQAAYVQGRVSEGHVFGSSALLPLDVLKEPLGILAPCAGCRRMQSLHCFTLVKRGKQVKTWLKSNICRICQIKTMMRDVNYPLSWMQILQ
ncbi:ribonuclease H-like domain-containing protein [Hygrophoropsis aurantiaca]|uniref:Ribonuclease H-like domain-containing protein n=1 Tax=Hygrophoropsis aurantiaca TaxID=72124 RepID=A0ACB8AT32_9AGAM|nr:ribonuclease H-like domain-containing protein [Hygrophoropsis aurantiaca]